MIDMHNKTVVVTGANSGVGFVTAKRLADAGAEIVMVCRDARRGEEARSRIAESATGPPPQLFIADLSSQQEIRDLARDMHFAHDQMLQDQLLAAPAARVVTVASEIYSRKLDFENLQGERSYNFFKAYQQSKLCNVLFAFELARRLQDTNVTSNVVSPGPSKTGFGATMKGPARAFTRVMKATPRFGTPEKGARTLVYATTDPELDAVTGHFYYKEKELVTKPVTRDTEIAAHLWQISDEMCGPGKGSQDHASALSA